MTALLHHIVEEGIRNVVFLSGDEHLFCLARARIARKDGTKSQVIHSVHSSPLYAPFPFANAVRSDFRATDRYEFNLPGHAQPYRCKVTSRFPRACNGFAEILVSPATPVSAWSVEVRFHDADTGVPTRWFRL